MPHNSLPKMVGALGTGMARDPASTRRPARPSGARTSEPGWTARLPLTGKIPVDWAKAGAKVVWQGFHGYTLSEGAMPYLSKRNDCNASGAQRATSCHVTMPHFASRSVLVLWAVDPWRFASDWR